MTSKYTRWIQILSILLALLAMGQLMFCATILFLISVILSKGGGYVATICGLIGSLVCLPTAFKIRSFYSKSEIKVRHYDMQTYHRCMLYISLGVQTFCALVCVASLTQGEAPEVALTSAITKYQQKFSDKKFMDIVQVLFQCCGIYSYQDWAQKSWISETKQQIFCRQEFHDESVKSLELSPTAELNAKFLTAVPYTCCKIETAKPCRNFDLKCSGTKTINTFGCLQQLSSFIISILCSELIIFIFSIFVLALLLKFFNMEEQDLYISDADEYSRLENYDSAIDNNRWGKFENTPGSSDPYMSNEDKKLLDENRRGNLKSYQTQDNRVKRNSKDIGQQAELAPSKQEQLYLSPDNTATLIPTDSDVKESKSMPHFMVDRQQYTMGGSKSVEQSKQQEKRPLEPKKKPDASHSGGHHPSRDPRNKDPRRGIDKPKSRLSFTMPDKMKKMVGSEKKNDDRSKKGPPGPSLKRRLSDNIKDKIRRISSSEKREPDLPSSSSGGPNSTLSSSEPQRQQRVSLERPRRPQGRSKFDDHYYDSLRNNFLVDKSVGRGNQSTPLVQSSNTSTFSVDQNPEEKNNFNITNVSYNDQNLPYNQTTYDSSTSEEPVVYRSLEEESFSQQILKKPSEQLIKSETFSQQILAAPRESFVQEPPTKAEKKKAKAEERRKSAEKNKPVEKKDIVEKIMEKKASKKSSIKPEDVKPEPQESPRRSTLRNLLDFVRGKTSPTEVSLNNSIKEPKIKSTKTSLSKVEEKIEPPQLKSPRFSAQKVQEKPRDIEPPIIKTPIPSKEVIERKESILKRQISSKEVIERKESILKRPIPSKEVIERKESILKTPIPSKEVIERKESILKTPIPSKEVIERKESILKSPRPSKEIVERKDSILKSPRASKEVVESKKKSASEENFEDLLKKLEAELKSKKPHKEEPEEPKPKPQKKTGILKPKKKIKLPVMPDDEEDVPKKEFRKTIYPKDPINLFEEKSEEEEKEPSEESKSISSEIELKSTIMDQSITSDESSQSVPETKNQDEISAKTETSQESLQETTRTSIKSTAIEVTETKPFQECNNPLLCSKSRTATAIESSTDSGEEVVEEKKPKQTVKVANFEFPEVEKINPSKKSSKKKVIQEEEYKPVEEVEIPEVRPIKIDTSKQSVERCLQEQNIKVCKKVSFPDSTPYSSDDQSEPKSFKDYYSFDFDGLKPRPCPNIDSPLIIKSIETCDNHSCKKTYPKSCMKKKKRPKKAEMPSWQRTLTFLEDQSETEVSECPTPKVASEKRSEICEGWEVCEENVKTKLENTDWEVSEDKKLTLDDWRKYEGNNYVEVPKSSKREVFEDKSKKFNSHGPKPCKADNVGRIILPEPIDLNKKKKPSETNQEPEEQTTYRPEEQTSCRPEEQTTYQPEEKLVPCPKKKRKSKKICSQKSSAQIYQNADDPCGSVKFKTDMPCTSAQICDGYEDEQPRKSAVVLSEDWDEPCGSKKKEITFAPLKIASGFDDNLFKRSPRDDQQESSPSTKKKKGKKSPPTQICEGYEGAKPRKHNIEIAEDDWEICEEKPDKTQQNNDWEPYEEANIITKPCTYKMNKQTKKKELEVCCDPVEEQPITSSEEESTAPEQIEYSMPAMPESWLKNIRGSLQSKNTPSRPGIMAAIERSYALLKSSNPSGTVTSQGSYDKANTCRKCISNKPDIEARLVKDKEEVPLNKFCTNPMGSQFNPERADRKENIPEQLPETKFTSSILAGCSGSATEEDDFSDLDVKPKKCSDRPGCCTKLKRCSSPDKCGYSKIIKKKYEPPNYEPDVFPDLRKSSNRCQGCCDQGRSKGSQYIHSRDIPKFHKDCSGKRDRIVTPSDFVKTKRQTFSTKEEAMDYEKKWTLPRFSPKKDPSSYSVGKFKGGPNPCCIAPTQKLESDRFVAPSQPCKNTGAVRPRQGCSTPRRPCQSPRDNFAICPVLPINKCPYEQKKPSPRCGVPQICSPQACGKPTPTCSSLTQAPFPQNQPQMSPPGPTLQDKSSLSKLIQVTPIPVEVQVPVQVSQPIQVEVPVPYEVQVPVEVPVPYPVQVPVPVPVERFSYSGNYPEYPTSPRTYEPMRKEPKKFTLQQMQPESKEVPSKDSNKYKIIVSQECRKKTPEVYAEVTRRPPKQEFSYSPKAIYSEYNPQDVYSPSPQGPSYEAHHTSPRTPCMSPRGSILKKAPSCHPSNRSVTFNLEHTCNTYCKD